MGLGTNARLWLRAALPRTRCARRLLPACCFERAGCARPVVGTPSLPGAVSTSCCQNLGKKTVIDATTGFFATPNLGQRPLLTKVSGNYSIHQGRLAIWKPEPSSRFERLASCRPIPDGARLDNVGYLHWEALGYGPSGHE